MPGIIVTGGRCAGRSPERSPLTVPGMGTTLANDITTRAGLRDVLKEKPSSVRDDHF